MSVPNSLFSCAAHPDGSVGTSGRGEQAPTPQPGNCEASLQNAFAQSREDQFYGEARGGVLAVQDSVDLNHVHGDQALGGGDQFHCQVRLTVAQAATYQRADAGGFAWVEGVHIQAEMDGIVMLAGDGDGAAHDLRDAKLVDLGHGEDMNFMLA